MKQRRVPSPETVEVTLGEINNTVS